MFSVLFPLFLRAVTASPSLPPGSRCLSESDLQQDEARPSLVQTVAGPLLGLRQTQIDPRQNQSVSWTSYFVSQSSEPELL